MRITALVLGTSRSPSLFILPNRWRRASRLAHSVISPSKLKSAPTSRHWVVTRTSGCSGSQGCADLRTGSSRCTNSSRSTGRIRPVINSTWAGRSPGFFNAACTLRANATRVHHDGDSFPALKNPWIYSACQAGRLVYKGILVLFPCTATDYIAACTGRRSPRFLFAAAMPGRKGFRLLSSRRIVLSRDGVRQGRRKHDKREGTVQSAS